MNKAQKEVQQTQLNDEKKVIKLLELVYEQAKKDCEQKIRELSARTDLENLQSIIYQKEYQQIMVDQIESILYDLHEGQFTTIADYLQQSYINGYVGMYYDLHLSGIPLVVPINQDQVVKAVRTDSKLSSGLYTKLGEDVGYLKRSIRAELSRGIASGSTWNEMALRIAKGMNSPFRKAYNNAIRIARTEGHRIQNEAALDGQHEAKKKGADIVKQWDATLDSRTRPEHREADGQIMELDEPFDVGGEKMQAPGVGGSAKNVCNCRCCLLQRAKWALDDDELKTLVITADDIVGIQVDYKNKTFKRLAGAANLTKGSDFDKFTMFGGRKRCNVADDGSIVAWYGDADYKEDGSMGQVMVYQPKFYYLVCPVEYDPIDTGIGYHLRKANYYVSEKPRAGFRLHPAFYDASGNEIDYFLTSAYEGSIYDASASAYLLNDEQVMNTGEDKFSSIAGARPASGSSQNLTRPNIEAMAQNRGTNWHGDLIKQVSAEQMLMIIEMGMMNLQTAIAQGVVSLPWTTGSDTTSSYAAATGSTASLGNGTGRAEKTTTYEGSVAKEYTVDGKTSVCWRGKENFWGNIWKFVYGINIWGNGKMGGGQPYICSDFSFAESKNSGNYEPAGFTVTNANGYISAMGYSTACDWLFIASECLGNSSLPVGDYTYITVNLNGYRIARLGGAWTYGGAAGGFCWSLAVGVGYRYRALGGRLVYIPTRDSATYTAAIEAWKQKMAA